MSKTNRRDFLIKVAPIMAAPRLLPILPNSLIDGDGMLGTAKAQPGAKLGNF